MLPGTYLNTANQTIPKNLTDPKNKTYCFNVDPVYIGVCPFDGISFSNVDMLALWNCEST